MPVSSILRFPVTAAVSVVLIAGCAAESKSPPVSIDQVGSASQMPQSPDSLPLGSATAAPLDPAAGDMAITPLQPLAHDPRTQAHR